MTTTEKTKLAMLLAAIFGFAVCLVLCFGPCGGVLSDRWIIHREPTQEINLDGTPFEPEAK